MGGGVVRNRFRQARYDKLKAALMVKRAKHPPSMKCMPSAAPDQCGRKETSVSPGGISEADATTTDGDQEFSSSDSSANEAEHAPSSKVPP